ncbi:competence protein CoiA [Parageobacillus thermoglucosidasius]|uniref:competence protein CoiA n=1 Tax=Parageobacillus thermoglucosidasius TaxID=1426 RepID=UPI00211763F4|nr:competence protein CoiA family protein [Parageobacillus thermoglucosidasius]
MTKGCDILLVALLRNGEVVSLAKAWTKEELVRLKRKESFFCPACKREVVLKLGNHRIPHFAHKKDDACPYEHEPESARHLTGKFDLFSWLQRQNIQAKLEPYLPPVQQRPDILVAHHHFIYAVEYQCSAIREILFRKRNDSYRAKGIRPIWILGAHHLRYRNHHISLPRFQWMFAHHFPLVPRPLLFFYCSETKRLIRLVHLIPFSVRRTFAIPVVQPLHSLSFSDLLSFPAVSLPASFWHDWLNYKQRWRLTFPLYPDKITRLICYDFYRRGIIPSLFPTEAGWPLPHGYLFETPPFIWQTYVLIPFMQPERKLVPLDSIYRFIGERLAAGRLAARQLPLATGRRYTQAVYEYLQLLTKLGYFQWEGRKCLRLVKEFTFPNTMDEVIQQDRQMMEQMKRQPPLFRYINELELNKNG